MTDTAIKVTDCLELFTRREVLTGSESWICPSCDERRDAFKDLGLWRLPRVLILQLKRFSSDGKTRTKLEEFVDFPLRDLALEEWASNGAEKGSAYDLFAVVNHVGGLGGGHYTAFAKDLHSEQWFSFDDARVAPVPRDRVASSAAYILFYRKQIQ
jgi:ubiquitin carboxyl-terminal hydrolase 4/11/15